MTAKRAEIPHTEILIASRKSDFKSSVVARVINETKGEAGVHLVGIDDLSDIDASVYTAIVIINTCMGLRADYRVTSFLDKQENLDSIIVLTTSGSGDMLLDTEKYDVDAIASASTPAAICPVADKIVAHIQMTSLSARHR